MLRFNNDNYQPFRIFKNPHINTVYPYLFRPRLNNSFERHRHHLPDGDFIDLDWIKNKSKKLVLLCHGLEGSTESKYIQHISNQFSEYQYDVCALNFRSCSGEININPSIYHSGATDDLMDVITNYTSEYDNVLLIGFSLGGNIVLKLSGESASSLPSNISGVVAISVPCELESGSYELLKPKNSIYTNRFLVTLKAKAKVKHTQFPGSFDLDYVLKSKNVFEFDDRFTAPVHGFKNAIDYYRKARSIQFLHLIQIPCLIINAADDTFLSKECYPFELADKNKNIDLRVSRYGGHVGFTILWSDFYWHEVQIFDWLSQ